MSVKNSQNEDLGTVEDLWVDMESGRVVLVVLSSGGFVGLGESMTAVPPGALRHDIAKKGLHLDADKAKMTSAPKFDPKMWEKSSSSNGLAAIYRHFGEERAFDSIGEDASRRDGPRSQTSGPRSQMDERNQKDKASDQRYAVKENRDQKGDYSRSNSSGYATKSSEGLGKVQSASDLMGMTVKNHQDQTVGDVEDIVVDLSSGRMVAVVLSSGGFLGMGDELSAVPPTALRWNKDEDAFQLDVTKEKLSSAPHFKANQWPDFAQPAHANGIYSAFHVEPYFSADAAVGSEKSWSQTQDEKNKNLTAMDQGNSRADRTTTASIRKEINASKKMSVNAQNVTIITRDGKVTLRGLVDSAEEKRLIGEIANRIARSANVDNQLEVKFTVSSN